MCGVILAGRCPRARPYATSWWRSTARTRSLHRLSDRLSAAAAITVSARRDRDSRAGGGTSRRNRALADGPLAGGLPTLRTTACPPRWSSSAARAHAVVVSVLTPAEVLIAARRLAGARPYLAAVAGIARGPVAAVP